MLVRVEQDTNGGYTLHLGQATASVTYDEARLLLTKLSRALSGAKPYTTTSPAKWRR